MRTAERQKKRGPSDWHRADIKAALEKAGWTIRRLAQHHGISHRALTHAFCRPYPRAEQRIAAALGLAPEEIWPTRYVGDPAAKRQRLKRDADSANGSSQERRRNGKDRRSR
ncbi:MAG: helix-turn-helix domain-containing protein [Burkholderiales bacterium]|nr:helix-turn-helix domain-containing protein [Burkholderiales bacterium]